MAGQSRSRQKRFSLEKGALSTPFYSRATPHGLLVSRPLGTGKLLFLDMLYILRVYWAPSLKAIIVNLPPLTPDNSFSSTLIVSLNTSHLSGGLVHQSTLWCE